ncbi:MAG: YncE family protein, partial [Chitinophagaceae bacterium]
MKNLVPFLLLFILRNGHAQTLPQPLQLPNGWKISPVGKSFDLGDLPLNIAVSKSNKYLAVTNNGQSTQSIQLIDVKSERILDQVEIEKSWYGITFTSDEKFIYVSGGHDNRIVKYEIINQQLKRIDSISLDRPWPVRVGPAGIALDESNNMMYVVTREDKMLYAVDMRTKQVVNKYGLDAEAYDCKFSSKTNELYITCWGCDKVLVFDTKNRQWKQPIGVGDNPNEMLLTNDAKYLYVCNANDNSVSIIDLSKKAVIETLDAALYPNSPSGSTTNSIALDPVGKKLYIANADNNCLATFDVSVPGNSKPKGFIPVGWYPTSVRFINGKIWVANGKGMTSKANPFGPSPLRKKEDVIHHG